MAKIQAMIHTLIELDLTESEEKAIINGKDPRDIYESAYTDRLNVVGVSVDSIEVIHGQATKPEDPYITPQELDPESFNIIRG